MNGRRRLLRRGLALSLLLTAPALVACGASGRAHAGATVVATDRSCSLSGTIAAGDQMVTVDDQGTQATEVYVVGSGTDSNLQFGSIEDVGPGTSAGMPVDVGPGSYDVLCEPGRNDQEVQTTGFTVAGPGAHVAGVPTVTDADIEPPITAYKQYVSAQLDGLTAALGPLAADVDRGDRAAAEAAYPVAHAWYERIGAVYDAFGALNDAINGLPDGLPKGTADPSFTGFHELELQLWSGAPTAVLAATVRTLQSNVGKLQGTLTEAVILPVDYVTRAHEILENALQEQVTGLAEPASHTGIDDTAASTTGAYEVFTTLKPLLTRQDAGLVPQVQAGFDRLDATLATLGNASRGYCADDALSTAQREQLTASIDVLLSDLDQIPGLLETPKGPREDTGHDDEH